MIIPRRRKAACERPSLGRWVVKFRAPESAMDSAKATCDKDLAIRQQCRCVKSTSSVELAGLRPSPTRRIVQFRVRTARSVVACDQDLAVRQQCRRVINVCAIQSAGLRPSSSRWIVQFCGILRVPMVVAARDEHPSIR